MSLFGSDALVVSDITPAALVSGLVTEHGVYAATVESLGELRTRLDGSGPPPDSPPDPRPEPLR